jgi:hypothetical protein
VICTQMETDPSFSERTVTRKKANSLSINNPQCCYNVVTVFYSGAVGGVKQAQFQKVSKVLQ